MSRLRGAAHSEAGRTSASRPPMTSLRTTTRDSPYPKGRIHPPARASTVRLVARRALPFLVVVALWAAAPAHAQTFSTLVVVTSRSETAFAVSGAAGGGTARVQVSVPAGFTLSLARPVGAVLGRARFGLSSAADPQGQGSSTEGDVVVADPARYAGNPRYQACAPGPHAAVWRLEPLDVPVFVDQASGPDAALGGYELRVCFDLPSGLSFQTFELDLTRTIVPATTPGIYIWRAFITPTTTTGSVDEGGTWEVRGLVPWPIVLTLKARREKAKARYLLYGRLVLAGKPRGGATIRILRFTPDTAGSTSVTITLAAPKSAVTNRAGRFHTAVRVTRRTDFFAIWLPFPRESCSTPSTAPGGCLTETTSPAVSDQLVVRPKRK